MRYKFKNRASTTLSHALAVDATSVQLASGSGVLFPALGVDECFMATIINAAGSVEEIVQVTAIVGEICTVVRGQEGTAAATFAVGSIFEHRLTAQAASSFFQAVDGGTISGPLNMDGNSISNVWFPDPTALAAVHTNYIRGFDVDPADADFVGALVFPPGKNGPSIGWADGISDIVSMRILRNIVFPWSGFGINLESWWKVCDGTNGTPDLRRRFIIGANYPPIDPADPITPYLEVGGSFVAATDPGGTHNHGGVTQPTRLGTGNLPPVIVNLQAFGKGTAGAAPYPVDGGTTRYSDGAQYTHAHGINAEGDHQHSITMVQPFYSLIYVMLNVA